MAIFQKSAVGMRLVEAASAAGRGVPRWGERSVVEHGMQGLRDRHIRATTLCRWTTQKVTVGGAPAVGWRSMPRTTMATRPFVTLLVDPSRQAGWRDRCRRRGSLVGQVPYVAARLLQHDRVEGATEHFHDACWS